MELRRRGILLLGLTLSDPDVFESVVPAALTFDYHTTNARNAVGMYRANGVHNTTWMPFGIDRDYMLADVPPAPELTADVICLGHAHRPERNETMLRLAQQHDVRVYGRGWALPGAEVVGGALQEGVAHDAGGVFERALLGPRHGAYVGALGDERHAQTRGQLATERFVRIRLQAAEAVMQVCGPG
jgi:hypothetical protein